MKKVVEILRTMAEDLKTRSSKLYDIYKMYSISSPSFGSRRWCHTNYNAKQPFCKYFEKGIDDVAYAIWKKCESIFTGDIVLQGYVEFFKCKTLKDLQRDFGGYWNEAHFTRKENKIYFHDINVVTEDGPWELEESEHETETATHFLAIEYEPPGLYQYDEALEDTFSEESEPDESTIVDWDEEVEDKHDHVSKKLRANGYILDEAVEVLDEE